MIGFLKLIAALYLLFPLCAFSACDATKALSVGIPFVVTLEPGVAQVIEWDMTDCWFGIQNWTVYATQPRACPSCLQKNLKPNTPLEMHLFNVTDGQLAFEHTAFVRSGGTVSGDVLQLTLLLSSKAKKPLAVEITTTGAFGGFQ